MVCFACALALFLRTKQKRTVVNNKSPVACASVRSVVALTFVAILGAVSAEAQIQSTVIATSGSAAPAGGNYQSFNAVSMNERGQAGSDAILIRTEPIELSRYAAVVSMCRGTARNCCPEVSKHMAVTQGSTLRMGKQA